MQIDDTMKDLVEELNLDYYESNGVDYNDAYIGPYEYRHDGRSSIYFLGHFIINSEEAPRSTPQTLKRIIKGELKALQNSISYALKDL